ncbi:MAG: hypothetical protein ACTS73_08075 [Arsenophonus sp. NEOnobi-MAG3]
MIAKHPYINEIIALTNGNHGINNTCYLVNIEQQVYEDEKIKRLINQDDYTFN